jgi:hypothetical protein
MFANIDWDLTVKVVLGIATIILSIVALHYKRLEHRKKVEEIVDGNAKIALFISRQSMLKHLLGMYERASSGDEIWGQCVSCNDYSQGVRDKVLEAAGRGISYRIIANRSTSSADFLALFNPLKSTQVVLADDNTFRIQGLSERECVIALPSASFYAAVVFRDPEIVKIFRRWFGERFGRLQGTP